MSNRDILRNIIIEELTAQPSVERQLQFSVIRAADEIIPDNLLEKPYLYFIKSSSSDEGQSIEFAIKTADNYIHDLTFNLIEHTICSMKLTEDTFIYLRSFFQSDPELKNERQQAYRAELSVISGESQLLTYTAEGRKKLVDKLIKFGRDLIQAQHSLK